MWLAYTYFFIHSSVQQLLFYYCFCAVLLGSCISCSSCRPRAWLLSSSHIFIFIVEQCLFNWTVESNRVVKKHTLTLRAALGLSHDWAADSSQCSLYVSVCTCERAHVWSHPVVAASCFHAGLGVEQILRVVRDCRDTLVPVWVCAQESWLWESTLTPNYLTKHSLRC